MQFSILHIASATLLLCANGLLLASLMTKYWSYYHMQIAYNAGGGVRNINKTGYRGLWELCHEAYAEPIKGYEACVPRFMDFRYAVQNDQLSAFMGSLHLDYEPWDMACLLMMCFSVGFGILAMFIAPVCCTQKFGIIHGLLVLGAALNGLLCVMVYAGFAMKSAMSQTSTWQKFDRFGYSFALGVIGAIVQLISAILFMVASCLFRRDGYKRANTE